MANSTLRQRIEALRDEAHKRSTADWITADGKLSARVRVLDLNYALEAPDAALALPDGPEPLSAEDYGTLLWLCQEGYDRLECSTREAAAIAVTIAKCRAHAEARR